MHEIKRGDISTHASTASDAYWSLSADALLAQVGTTSKGLSSEEAAQRLTAVGPNSIRAHDGLSRLRVLLAQVRSPLLLLLVFAAGASGLSGEWLDAGIVAAIILATIAVGYSREYRAQSAAAALTARVRVRASVLRDGVLTPTPHTEIVPGDIVALSAGSLVPADAVLLEATDLFVSEAVLTGESFPVEKQLACTDAAAGLSARTNCVFLGTNVRSGTGRAVVVRTGPATQFGSIAHRLSLRPPETEFDRGIRRFGYLLTSAMLALVLLIFALHVMAGRSPVDTLLFAVALAVGLSPELLPAILSVNLARGAQMMARHGVLVRRLNAIENLGSMDVLCTDKTGTLTEGVVELEGAFDADGQPSPAVLELATWNAALATGLHNPLDEAILRAAGPAPSADIIKRGEIPFDFVHKRVSVAVSRVGDTEARLVTKGAFPQVLAVCTRHAHGLPFGAAEREAVERRCEAWSRRGVRVVAVACRSVPLDEDRYSRADERDMTFVGLLTFIDRPKPGVAEALASLTALGVSVKVITGDHRFVAEHVASLVGLPSAHILTGAELDDLHDEALWHRAERTDLFVQVDPNQKERIILALKRMGHVVGFLGDGINDAPAMHAADTSLSVEQAVDVAREAADFVLLERGLEIIARGIEEGRRTFANILKYVLITTSANLGNMISMGVISLFLPFLPLLPAQILLNNFLSDIPALGLAGDAVDPELLDHPRRWNMRFIGRFMVTFGLVSSVFDFLTVGALLGLFHATPEIFRTGWFVESLLTELVIALVVRTRRPFFRSRPGRLLLVLTGGVIALTFAIPYVPGAAVVGFVPLPGSLLALVSLIAALYVVATELVKRFSNTNRSTSLLETT